MQRLHHGASSQLRQPCSPYHVNQATHRLPNHTIPSPHPVIPSPLWGEG